MMIKKRSGLTPPGWKAMGGSFSGKQPDIGVPGSMYRININ
jgi:hypothetical protein